MRSLSQLYLWQLDVRLREFCDRGESLDNGAFDFNSVEFASRLLFVDAISHGRVCSKSRELRTHDMGLLRTIMRNILVQKVDLATLYNKLTIL